MQVVEDNLKEVEAEGRPLVTGMEDTLESRAQRSWASGSSSEEGELASQPLWASAARPPHSWTRIRSLSCQQPSALDASRMLGTCTIMLGSDGGHRQGGSEPRARWLGDFTGG